MGPFGLEQYLIKPTGSTEAVPIKFKVGHERFAQVAHDKIATVRDSRCSLQKRDRSELLMLLLTKERPLQFAQVAHDKRATASNSLMSLFT